MIGLGAPPNWPYPWPDADDNTVHFADQAQFMGYITAFRDLKQEVSESVGVVKAQMRGAETIEAAQALYDAWTTSSIE